jgi:hypothetical protein
MDVKVMMATGKLTSKNRLKKIPQVKETFDRLESKLFIERLNRIIEPQDKIDLKKKLEKFEDFRIDQEVMRHQAIAEERKKAVQDQIERRQTELNKMRRVISFNKDWNKNGEKNWTENMQKKHERDREEQKFRETQKEKAELRAEEKKQGLTEEVYGDLDLFEKKHLEEKDTDIENSQGDQLEGTGSNLDLNIQGLSVNASIKRNGMEHTNHYDELAKLIQSREKEMHSEYFRKERDKRRRKMIVDQSKGQKKIEVKRKEHSLLEKMIQESRQEEEIRYEFWRTRKAKELIVKNRELREDMYSNREDYVKIREREREETILAHMIEDFNFQVDLYLKREKTLRINKDIDKRDTNYSMCRKVVDILLNIADSCFEHNQDADQKAAEEIEPNYWDENLSLMKSNLDPFKYRNPRHRISTDIFKQDFHEENKYENFLNVELGQYLSAKGQWNLPSILTPKSHELPIDPKIDPTGEAGRVKIPSKPVNNEYLGNLVARLIDQKYPKKEDPPLPPYPSYLPIKLCLIGKFYSGKSTVTRYLQNKFNLEIISVEEIINEGIVRFGHCDDSYDHKEELEQHAFLQNGYASLLNDQTLDEVGDKRVDETELLENKSLDHNIEDGLNTHPPKDGLHNIGDNISAIPEAQIEGNGEGNTKISPFSIQGDAPDDGRRGINPVKSLIRKLYRGQEPSEEDYGQIIIDEIKKRHSLMSEEDYYLKLKENRLALIQEEKDRVIKEQEQTNEKVNLTRKKIDMTEKRKNIQIDEEQFTLVPPAGFVLLDFPNSVKQAKVLERMMTNFLSRDKIPKSEAQIEKEFLIRLMKPSEKELPPKSLKPSGFDLMLYLEASNSSCLYRAFGDYKTPRDMHYHLVANPPPVDQTPLVETLVFNENQQKNQYLMADLNKNRSLDLPTVVDLYEHFGTNSDGKKTIMVVDANQDMTSLLANIDEIISDLLSKKNSYYVEFEKKLEERRALEEKKKLDEEERLKKEAQMKLADPSELSSLLSKAKEGMTKDPLRPDVLENLLGLWTRSSRTYVQKAYEVFKGIRECREIVSVVLAEHQRSILQLLESDDEKKQWLYEYQKMYNSFIDENPDMLEQEAVKEEFHQR